MNFLIFFQWEKWYEPIYIRVALKNGRAEDYANLNIELANRGFLQVLVARNGQKFLLPCGEYTKLGNFMIEEVINLVEAAAKTVSEDAAIVVTNFFDQRWRGLDRA
jgi:hypothetical protein